MTSTAFQRSRNPKKHAQPVCSQSFGTNLHLRGLHLRGLRARLGRIETSFMVLGASSLASLVLLATEARTGPVRSSGAWRWSMGRWGVGMERDMGLKMGRWEGFGNGFAFFLEESGGL